MAYEYFVESTSINFGVLLLTLRAKNPNDRFPFAPGQYVSIGFKRGGRPTPVRCFSIVSSPNETKLQFGMRIHGHFTRAAARLQPGDKVKVNGPFGDFTFSQDDRQIVMLAGGIGITPFISMVRYATEARLPMNITLLYTSRSANTPFANELLELADKNPRLRIYFFNTSEGRTPASTQLAKFINGSITQAHLERLTTGAYAGSSYFICGPKGFMKGMQKGLERSGVDASYIITESFASASVHGMLGGFGIQPLTYGLSTAALIAMTGFIMFLGLSRTSATPRTATTQNSTTSNAASSSSTTSNSPTTTAPSTSEPSNTDNSSSNTVTYQQPVSSVS